MINKTDVSFYALNEDDIANDGLEEVQIKVMQTAYEEWRSQ